MDSTPGTPTPIGRGPAPTGTGPVPTDTGPVPAGMDLALAFELERWRTAEPGTLGSGFALAYLVAALARCTGRQYLGEPLLAALAEVADRHRGHDPYLDAFLDGVLARRRGDDSASAYLALPLLELVLADERSRLDLMRLAALVLADLVRHEQLPQSQVDGETRTRRTRHAAGFLTATEPTLGLVLPTPPGTEAGDWLALTALPESLAHDEYFLIRVLQARELVFAALTVEVRAAATAARATDTAAATGAVRRAVELLDRALLLVRLAATLRVSDYHRFRSGADLTASAGHDRFAAALNALAAAAALPAGTAEDVDLAAARALLHGRHERWRAAHRALVARMLTTDAA